MPTSFDPGLSSLAWRLAAVAAGLLATALACRWPRPPSWAVLIERRSRARTVGLVLTAALVLMAVLQRTPGAAAVLALTGGVLMFLALVDLRRFTLPLAGLVALAAALAAQLWLQPSEVLPRLATGGALLLLFATLWRIPTRGRRMLGGGDVVLAGLIGALVGWRAAPLVFAFAALAPLVVQLAIGRRGPVPFGFWLCVAALPALAWTLRA